MSEELKNIFNDFDPGVGDDHVEQRWQAIRPLLPPEESSRTGLFFLKNKNLRVLAIAAVLLIVIFASLFYFSNFSEHKVADRQTPPSGPTESAPAAASSGVLKEKKEGKIHSGHSVNTITSGINERTPSDAEVSVVPSEKTEAGLTGNKVNAASKTPKQKDMRTEFPGSTGEANFSPNSDYAAESTKTDSLSENQIVFLHPIQTTLPGVNERHTVSEANEVKPLRGAPSRKLIVEIFAGADRYNNSYLTQNTGPYTTLKASGSGERSLKSGYTYVVGVSLQRSFGRRIFVPVQASYTGPQNVYNYERQGAVKITKPVTATAADSSARYKSFTEVTGIKMKSCFSAGLGLGLRLFATPLFTLNAQVAGDINLASYERTNKVTFSGVETSSPPAYYYNNPQPMQNSNAFSSSAYDPNSSASYVVRSFGASGTLQAARRIAQRMAVTSRLTYHSRLQTTELPGKYSAITFTPKDLMLTFGISYQW